MSHQPGTHLSDSANLFEDCRVEGFLQISRRMILYIVPKWLGSFSSVFRTHVLPCFALRRMTDLMICPEAKVSDFAQHGMGCYIIAQRCCNWSEPCIATCWDPAQHGLGPERFVEWSTCLRTWSMSSRLCKEWFDLQLCMVFISFCIVFTIFTTCPPQLAWIVGLWRLVGSIYLVNVIIWPTVFNIRGYMRMGEQRTWCFKENILFLCFLRDMSQIHISSHLHVYTSSSFG